MGEVLENERENSRGELRERRYGRKILGKELPEKLVVCRKRVGVREREREA